MRPPRPPPPPPLMDQAEWFVRAYNFTPPDLPAHEPPVRYRVAGTPPGYGYLVRRHVALRPVAGSADFRDPQRAVDRYLEVWRRRLVDLGTIHYERFEMVLHFVRERVQRFLDCPPPFCAVTPAAGGAANRGSARRAGRSRPGTSGRGSTAASTAPRRPGAPGSPARR